MTDSTPPDETFRAGAAILCGGLGTRLGELTAQTPKPLLAVGGLPFLEYQLFELGRHGLRSVLLLAGHNAAQIADFAANSSMAKRFGITVHVSSEAEPLGTGGAVKYAEDKLADEFLLLNGDTWFSVNYLALLECLRSSKASAILALRRGSDGERYNVIGFDGEKVTGFEGKGRQSDCDLINGGVAAVRRSLLSRMSWPSSLENDVWPSLVAERELGAQIHEGFFLDIGIPSAFDAAQSLIPAALQRPAVFLDRDGVINRDYGYVGTVGRFDWVEGAQDAVRLLNDRGYYVFIVTNQAGVARGYYSERDIAQVHGHMKKTLAGRGAHIDAIRYCPHHEAGSIGSYRKSCGWRKPAPGMILDLLQTWPVDRARSFLVGDKQIDCEAATAAGIKSYLFGGGSLEQFIRSVL